MSTEPVNPLPAEYVSRLDPQLVELYNKYFAHIPPFDEVSYEEYKANIPKYTANPPQPPHIETASDKIYKIPVKNPDGEIAVQVFVPTKDSIEKNNMQNSQNALPAYINYHGGGFVFGGLKSDEYWLRKACQGAGIIMINVDYRMCPDYHYMTSVQDSYSALVWVMENAAELGVDKNRVGTGGASSGAHLSAVLSIMARDNNLPPLKLQLLSVGSFDARYTPIDLNATVPEECPYESQKELQNGPQLTIRKCSWFCNLWLGTDPEKRKKEGNTWIASPMVAESHKDLAPASFHAAEFDLYWSQSVAYHEKLLNAGVKSQIKIYKGVTHPFFHMKYLDAAEEYFNDTIDVFKSHFKL